MSSDRSSLKKVQTSVRLPPAPIHAWHEMSQSGGNTKTCVLDHALLRLSERLDDDPEAYRDCLPDDVRPPAQKEYEEWLAKCAAEDAAAASG